MRNFLKYLLNVCLSVVPVHLSKLKEMITSVAWSKEKYDLYCSVARAHPPPEITWRFQHYPCQGTVSCTPEPDKWKEISLTDGNYKVRMGFR